MVKNTSRRGKVQIPVLPLTLCDLAKLLKSYEAQIIENGH